MRCVLANNPVALALKDEGIEANAQDRYGRKYRNEQYDLFMSNIPKWRQEPTYSRIMQEYTSGLKIPNYTPSYPKMEAKLAMEIRSKRKRKRRVSPRWIRSRALEILKEDPSAREGGRDSNAVDRWQEFTASRTWARKFMTRNRFSIRKKTNSKKYSVVERMPLLASWTRRFRAKLNEGPPQCDVYGQFDLHHRFNVDQVPLPFVVEKNYTIDDTGVAAAQIKGPSESLEKRQCTLQVCFRGVGQQPRLAIIFRGEGNITDVERRRLDASGCDYYFNGKAWASPEFTEKWVANSMKETLKSLCPDGKPVILLADNLAGQDTRFSAGELGRRTRAQASTIGFEWWNFPSGCTDAVQPVDAGLGRELKRAIGIISDEWLSNEINITRWEGGDPHRGIKPLAAWERRCLLAEWAAEGWRRLCARPKSLQRYFEKTGCHIAITTSQDHKIRLEQMSSQDRARYREAIAKPFNAEDDAVCLSLSLTHVFSLTFDTA